MKHSNAATKGTPLTPKALQALRIIRDHGRPMRAREFARQMWPDSPSWTRASGHKREKGILRVAGAFLRRLEEKWQLVRQESHYWGDDPPRLLGYVLTTAGARILAEDGEDAKA